MRFTLDTNVASAILRLERATFPKWSQHQGQVSIPRPALAELYAWAYRWDPARRLESIEEFLKGIEIIEFDDLCSRTYGRLFVEMRTLGVGIEKFDLLIAASAIAHGLILVTRNTSDFEAVPAIRLANWFDDP